MGLSKKRDSVVSRLGLLFSVFALVLIAASGFFAYKMQEQQHKTKSEETVKHVAFFLENLLLSDGVNFAYVQDYVLSNYENINISFDFADCHADRRIFEQLFASRYPGKTLGVNIKFAELDDEVKKAYAIYKLEYVWDLFEKSIADFEIRTAFYLVPTGEKEHLFSFIDGERTEKIVDGKKYLRLCSDIKKPRGEHRCLWETWETGKRGAECEFYDGEAGRVCAYYTPLTVNGRQLGVVGAATLASEMNGAVLRTVFRQIALISAIIASSIVLVLLIISKKYIAKITELENDIRLYAMNKDVEIAKKIEDKTHGKNEIASLALTFSELIRELENYMNELSASKQHAAELHELSNKDALTGIRNRTAFESEAQKIDWKIAAGYRDFGIAVIDMNFLKRINDTFGHDKGNIAIKKLCYIVCHQFEHSPVFKIGGDEFAVILEDSDFQNSKHLTEQFNNQILLLAQDETLEDWEKVSASLGFALFDEMLDETLNDVFERAKKAMFARKKMMRTAKNA